MDGIVLDVVDSIVVNFSSDNDSEGSTSSSEDPDWRGLTSTREWVGKCVLNW
jgi:hypothetical protein